MAFRSLSARGQVRCFGICFGFGITNSWGAGCGEHWGSPSVGGEAVLGELQPRGRAGGRAAADAAARAPAPSPRRSIARLPPATRGSSRPGAPRPRAAAGHSGGRIQITSRRQPIRGEGAGPGAPRFPRRASLRGELGGRRGAGSQREAEVLGIPGGTGNTEHGRLHACQRAWGSQHYPNSRAKGLWGVMICPSGSGVPGAQPRVAVRAQWWAAMLACFLLHH